MKLHELAEQCAQTLKSRSEMDMDQHGYIALVVQRPARLPFHGRLACEHEDGRRVYHVRIHHVFQYLAKATKPVEGGRL